MSLTPRIDTFENNLMTNGAFDYWQRGTNFSTTVRAYGADRWIQFTGNAAYASSITRQISGLTTSQYCLRAQRPNGTTNINAPFICQVTETSRTISSGIRGEKVYLRFLARKGANYAAPSSLLGVYLASGTGTNEPGPGVLSFTGQTDVIATSYVTLTTSWQEFTFEGNIPNNCSQLRLEFGAFHGLSGTAGAADYFEIAEVSLTKEETNKFTYAGRDIIEELRLCQRYYEKSYHIETPPGTNTSMVGMFGCAITSEANTSNTASFVPFRVLKRISPTWYYWDEVGNQSRLTVQNSGNTRQSNVQNGAAVNATSESGYTVSVAPQSVSGFTGAFFHWAADAEI